MGANAALLISVWLMRGAGPVPVAYNMEQLMVHWGEPAVGASATVVSADAVAKAIP